MLDSPQIESAEASQSASCESNRPGLQLVDLLARRCSLPALRLGEPGLEPDEIRRLLTVATRVPDHGMLEPWRVVLIQGSSRETLGARLTAALLKGNLQQDPAGSDLAVRKIKVLLAAPLIVIVVSRADASARIPEWEQIPLAGAVCMNLITASFALAYGSIWLTGWPAYDPAALRILGVQLNEKVELPVPFAGSRMKPLGLKWSMTRFAISGGVITTSAAVAIPVLSGRVGPRISLSPC